jgi:hypothetical protein
MQVFPFLHIRMEGFTDSQSIANGFASYFAGVCKTVPDDCFRTQLFEKRLSSYRSTITSKVIQVDVEILDIIVRGLKKGKAAGVDSLVTEHIQLLSSCCYIDISNTV